MQIRELFKIMIEQEASDLFLRTNAVPHMRVNGVVKSIGSTLMSKEEVCTIADYLLTEEKHKQRFKDDLDIDFAHYEPDISRFRVNIFMQRGTPSLVIRHIHTVIKNFEELGLPIDLLKSFCEESNGLVLVCGPAGSGKSTTIATMIDYINATNEKHIVTIEDPVEFLFKDNKSIINQRELGVDVLSYPMALKHVTQQSPDMIYIGNIRDAETMRAVITATELGAFVVSTFHTINAVQTITRIINFFPPYLHDEVRLQLSNLLKGIVSLRLVPRKDRPGRIPAYETMVVTPTIARLIRENKMNDIQNFIDEGALFGMLSFKRSLVRLVKDNVVDEIDARNIAISKDDFNLELKGIQRYQK